MHLTNYSINKSASSDVADSSSSETGSKWRVCELWRFLADRNHDVGKLMQRLVDIILKAIISCESSVNGYIRHNATHAGISHELFGFDIMLDEALRPWLLEINISPSLQSSTTLDFDVKSRLAKDVLNLAGIQLPAPSMLGTRRPDNTQRITSCFASSSASSALDDLEETNCCLNLHLKPSVSYKQSADEQAKSAHYIKVYDETGVTDPSILSCLTPHDLRLLVETEDEWERRGAFTRLMPSPFSSHYLAYLDRSRYANLLLDEWVSQYYHIRETGVTYLKSLCNKGIHLFRDDCPKEHQWLLNPKPTSVADRSSFSDRRTRTTGTMSSLKKRSQSLK
jgi:tubulin polyglutamylase TTLL4